MTNIFCEFYIIISNFPLTYIYILNTNDIRMIKRNTGSPLIYPSGGENVPNVHAITLIN